MSRETGTTEAWSAARSTTLLSVLLLAAGGASAQQEPGGLGNLIFEPVPLAAAPASRPPASADAIDAAALELEVGEHLAAIEPLRGSRPDRGVLLDRLGALAVAYQGLDRHDQALEALDEAVDLARDIHGRNGLEQVPFLEQQIPSYLARADLKRIDEIEEEIFELRERAYDAGGRQMYYATMNYADWLTTAYYRENYGSGKRALRRQMGVVQRVQRCIAMPGRVNEDGTRACSENPIFSGEIKDVYDQDINDARLRKIDILYKDYQEDLIDGGLVQLDIIMDLAKRVARLAFSTKQEMDFERENYSYDPIYEGSREQALRNSPARLNESYLTGERALLYAIELPSAVAGLRPEALAALYLDLGDWHLTYGKAAAAEAAYGEAYRVLHEAGFSSENIDRALETGLPVPIPVLATHLYTRRSTGLGDDVPLDYRGHLDVAFAVDSLGNTGGVRLLAAAGEAADEAWRLLHNQLQTLKFRPVLDEGELVARGESRIRYFYMY
jgi:hypothetical protein